MVETRVERPVNRLTMFSSIFGKSAEDAGAADPHDPDQPQREKPKTDAMSCASDQDDESL